MKRLKFLSANAAFSAVLTLVVLSSLILTPVFCRKPAAADSGGVKYEAIINVWHADTFDGGVGSRAAFLQKRADEFSKKHKGALVLVTARTVGSIIEDFKKGVYPDAISYGIGGIDPSAFLALNKKGLFKGGEIGGKFYGAAYLRGQYFLFAHGAGGEKKASEILVYSAENYSTATAAALSDFNGVSKKFVFTDKTQAARRFLNDKTVALIGTQRDLYRLKAAGAEFTAVPLGEFCDLYQYLSVITTDEVKNARIVQFLDYLLSDEAQLKAFNLMMLPVKSGLNPENADEDIKAAYSKIPNYTLPPYSLKSEIDGVKAAAEKTLAVGGDKDKSELLSLLKPL